MTNVIVPSSQLGISCSSVGCECGFGSKDDGVITHNHLSVLLDDGIDIAPSIYGYLSAENFSNSGDSVAEAIGAADASALASCSTGLPIFMSPDPEMLNLTVPASIDALEMQRMLGGTESPAFRRAFESMRRMQRRSSLVAVAQGMTQDMASMRRSVFSDLGRGSDMVAQQFGKTSIVIPLACRSFVDEDGVNGWRSLADGYSKSSNAASRSALSASLADAAMISGLGGALATDAPMSSDMGSQPSYRARSFCFHMSAGYPMGCVNLVDGTALPGAQTYRQPLSSSASANFSHRALASAARLIFRETGSAIASFSRRLMSPPTYLAISGVSGNSEMSSSWLGMMPLPSSLVDDMIRPMWLGMSDSGLQVESLVVAEDMERLLSVATSASHPQRYSVRRCLEHQFLHKKLTLASQTRVRVESAASNVSSLSWNLNPSSPESAGCLPDEMWCDLDDLNGHDWKALAAACGQNDSNWQAYRYSRPSLPSANPFVGMQITPSDFNSSQASAIANLPSLGAREVVDLIRWEFLEWTRQVGVHLVNLIATKGRYVAADTDIWKTLTHGRVEV